MVYSVSYFCTKMHHFKAKISQKIPHLFGHSFVRPPNEIPDHGPADTTLSLTLTRRLTLYEDVRGGCGLPGGAGQLASVGDGRVVAACSGHGQARQTLGDLDVVLVSFGDLGSRHEPRRSWRRNAAKLRLEPSCLPGGHLPRNHSVVVVVHGG